MAMLEKIMIRTNTVTVTILGMENEEDMTITIAIAIVMTIGKDDSDWLRSYDAEVDNINDCHYDVNVKENDNDED